jgi:hypothetical protein
MKGRNEMKEGTGSRRLKMSRPLMISKKVLCLKAPHLCVLKDLLDQRDIGNLASKS